MTNMKTLMLAALATLSLGVGSAMAQEGGPSMPTMDFWTANVIAAQQAAAANVHQSVQAGSSDTDTVHVGTGGGAPVNFSYGTLANPG
jgi:hypothetical protein